MGLTLAILFCIALIYTLAVWFGIEGISKLSTVCAGMFAGLLLYVLLFGGEGRYILKRAFNLWVTWGSTFSPWPPT